MERLNGLIEAKKLTNYRMAKDLQITEGAIRSWRKGRTSPSGKNLQALASYFNVSTLFLLFGDDTGLIAKPTVLVPVLGKCPAGYPETIAPDEILEHLPLWDVPKGTNAVLVKGDSMSPSIKDGEYALFLFAKEIKNGDVVIVCDEFRDMMLKRYKVKGKEQFLVSDNPEYPTFKPNSHYRIIGKVIEVINRRKRF